MSSFKRIRTLAELSEAVIEGANFGHEVKNFLHEFKESPSYNALEQPPRKLNGKVEDGLLDDCYLQALAVYLAAQINKNPPSWTQNACSLPKPWFASPGKALRHYLLMSSPAPFRSRNIFIDEDSLLVV